MEAIIYGGSFNPPTNAHAEIITHCLELPDVDEVWLLPSAERMDKNFGVNDTDRCLMLKLMHEEVFDRNPRLKICRAELDAIPHPTQTYKTVDWLEKHYPERSFRYVFGADSYVNMPKWQEGERLQRELAMLIIPRCGVALPREHLSDLPEPSPMSSTEVRQRVATGKPIDHLVCKSVQRYITERCLYRLK